MSSQKLMQSAKWRDIVMQNVKNTEIKDENNSTRRLALERNKGFTKRRSKLNLFKFKIPFA